MRECSRTELFVIVRLLQPQTVDAMAAHQRVGMHDHTFGVVMDWGLGFVLDTKYALGDRIQPYGYGARASTRTFATCEFESAVARSDSFTFAAKIVGLSVSRKNPLAMFFSSVVRDRVIAGLPALR